MKRIIYILVFFIASSSGLNAQINILDKTFGTDGKTALLGPKNFGGSLITDISILPNKKIIACGIIHDSVGAMILFASRYNENGILDSSFGANGYFIADKKLKARNAKLTTAEDGSSYIYGPHSEFDGFTESPFLLRLWEDGTLDTTFADEGIYGLNYTIGTGDILHIFIEKDKSLKVIGQTYSRTDVPIFPFIEKFSSNGQLDPSFGTNGRKLINPLDDMSIFAIDASIDAEGRLLLFISLSDYNYSIIRTNLEGVVDSTFGDKGIAQLRIGNGGIEYTTGVIMRDNSLLCIFNTYPEGYIEVDKVFPDGRIDSSFGQSGLARVNYHNIFCRGYKSIIDNDNNIVVAGYVGGFNDGTYSPAVFRLLSNGKIDSSFSLYGASIPFPSSQGESYSVSSN